MSKQYKIPVVWQMMGYTIVEADSEAEAVTKVMETNVPLPDNGEYLDESHGVDREGLANPDSEAINALPQRYFK
jgi:hypothetical protein